MMKEMGTADSGKNNETMFANTEILLKIFAYLPSTSLHKFKSVSKEIQRLIEELFLSEIALKIKDHPDIMFKIFTCLPPKDLYKYKCVSKEIRRLIEDPILALEHFKRLRTLSPFTGLFYQRNYMVIFFYKALKYYEFENPVFISTNPNIDSKSLPDSSLKYLLVDKSMDLVEAFDSCDGLILCGKYCNATDSYTCYVHNPLTMEKLVLHCLHEQMNRVKYALFAQTSSMGYIQYKVISVYRPKYGELFSELVIFSSETGKWENMKVKLPPISHDIQMGSKVIIEDVMFWDCLEGYILVYYFKKPKTGCCFELIRSPKSLFSRCLWDYEGKLHCYCFGSAQEEEEEEVDVWVLCSNGGKFEWRKEESEKLKNLAEDVWDGCHKLSRKIREKAVPRIRFEILRYDSNIKMVYLSIHNAVFSYEIRKRKLEFMFGYYMNKRVFQDTCALPYVHCMLPMEMVRRTDQKSESIICRHESSVAGSDAYYKLDELISQYTDLANNVGSTGRKKKKKRF